MFIEVTFGAFDPQPYGSRRLYMSMIHQSSASLNHPSIRTSLVGCPNVPRFHVSRQLGGGLGSTDWLGL